MLRLVLGMPEGLTKEKLRARRRKEMLSYNLATFGNVAVGIHGKELPKFSNSQNTKEYWTLPSVYKETPSIKLPKRSELQPDPFKATHIPKPRHNTVAGKVHSTNPSSHFIKRPSIKANPHWTKSMQGVVQSVYDTNPRERASELKYQQLPLPSSFTKSGIFPSAYDKRR